MKLFSESGQGSWMVMFLTTLLSLYLFGHFYSEFLRVAAGPQYDRYLITHNMGIQNETFMKLAAMGTWLGDFITAWMVTDMMLQVCILSNTGNKLSCCWECRWTKL